jgi:hypothetical protein
MIRKVGKKWVLYFSDGRKEEFKSKAAAERRESQVKMFKHIKKDK